MKEGYELIPCKTCGLNKEYGYRKGAYCGACTSKIRKSKRIYTTKLPHGSGRKPTCSTCGRLKESSRKNESRCKRCTSNAATKNMFKQRIEDGLLVWVSKLKAECIDCNKQKEKKTQAYCDKCNEKRINARQLIKNAVRRGEMQKLPCEICRKKEVEGHHDDYDKPLEVRWLCRKHHREYHDDKRQELQQSLLKE